MVAVRKKRRLGESVAIREAARKKIIATPLIKVGKGVKFVGTRTISTAQFKRLSVDESYQRVRVNEMVNSIIHALTSGGQVPDPVAVAVRPDDTWWLVDGQQRFYAHLETDTPMLANFYEVEDIDAERSLFIALNRRASIRPHVTVKSWAGVSAQLIREANEDEESPLKDKINFGSNASRVLDASVLAKGLLTATTNLWSQGQIERVLSRADSALKDNEAAMARAKTYLKLVGQVWGRDERTGRKRLLPVLALAMVAYRRWTAKGYATLPSTAVLNKLRRANWESVSTTHSVQYLPLYERFVETRWPAED